MSSEERGRKPKERKAVLVLPDIGLEEQEVEALKGRFENNLVDSLGGREALARRAVVVVVVVVVVAAEA
jgi:hypothetical protein